MPFARDLDLIEPIAAGADPSFAAVEPGRREAALAALRRSGEGADAEAFILAAMRLMALAGNGHTRVLPNPAIRVLPLRFLSLGDGVWLTRAGAGLEAFLDTRLVAVNGVPLAALQAAAAPFLAGTPQRRRVVGPILLAWPAALQLLGAGRGDGAIDYALADADGAVRTLRLNADPAGLVPALPLYPLRESGSLDGGDPDRGVACRRKGGRLFIRIPDLMDPAGDTIPAGIARAAEAVAQHRGDEIVLDLRGNPGGNFMLALPLVDAITRSREGRRCVVAVDRFTFSAAIVVAALICGRLGAGAVLAGEEPGDATRFFAEGETLTLPQSGALLRYSTAEHDWQAGIPRPTTPAGIARLLVPAGRLTIVHRLAPTPRDLRAGRDGLCALFGADCQGEDG